MYKYKIPPIDLDCGVTITQYVMGAKWKPYLINCMTKGIHRPVDFQRTIKGAAKTCVGSTIRRIGIRRHSASCGA